ncbi:hypothetical protein AJGP001_07160 [Planococcus faecalis]|uniref:G5 domain-containing protein n=1 Tax=Planococcus faecalis TaxID=1598147 RepID=A0ABM6IR15_9BACL|nr:VanW family protein [Planococcus faecalis]AQU79052.1 hypothetical protein AJGP001_07160 [Planococcus faecalis]
MNNQVFGKTFLTIFLSGLLFFGVSNAGATVIDKWLFPKEQFGDDTYIGTTNVSNMEVAGAMAQFSGTLENWHQSSELLVRYQDATANYPLDDAEILLEETAQQAQSGMQNSFLYNLPEKTTERFLTENFPRVAFSEAEVQKINVKLEEALEAGLEKTTVTISDDSLDVEQETVSKVAFPQVSINENTVAVVAAINGMQIAPGEKISFLTFINELKPIGLSDSELTEIASAIYAVVLKTNFKIEERSIGNRIPEKIAIGEEATINRSLGIDLVFSNPNASSFTLNTAFTDDSLTVSLEGFPFVYDYTVSTSSKEAVNPRLIKQYSAFVTTGKAIEEEGSEGVRVEIVRSIMDNGDELKVEAISTDFYPPINRIELYPLTAPPAEVVPETGLDGSLEEEQVPGESADEKSEADSESGKEQAAENIKTEADSGKADSSTDKETNNSTPNSDKNSETDKPIYDKGGNLVNP